MQGVLLDSDGRRISGDLISPPAGSGGLPGMLFLHGRGSDRRGYVRRAAAACAALQAICLIVDLSGHGESGTDPERFTPEDHLRDVLVAYRRLATHERVDPSRIGIVGASYGAYLAGLAAGRVPVRQLLLRAPALYDDASIHRPLADLGTSAAADADGFFEGIERSGADLLVLQSERDELIGADVIERYLTGVPRATRQVLPCATHVLSRPEWDGWFIGTIMSWGSTL